MQRCDKVMTSVWAVWWQSHNGGWRALSWHFDPAAAESAARVEREFFTDLAVEVREYRAVEA
jgi:hypothetical protein